MILWQPKKSERDWIVVMPETSRHEEYVVVGKDGNPLRFWSEKGAQIKADSMNRNSVKP